MNVITTTVRMSGEEHEDLKFLKKRLKVETLSDAIRAAIREVVERLREKKRT